MGRRPGLEAYYKEILRKRSLASNVPGMSLPARTIYDPERIRALTHPLRLELLDVLEQLGEATATQCAEQLGQSVASCSFHLRSLEKHGFIERGGQRGREKPWRAVQGGLDVRPDMTLSGSRHAVAELGSLYLARESDRVHRYLAQLEREPEDWVEAATVTTASFWATAEEMKQLAREVHKLTDRFNGRDDDESLRPDGARQARMLATLNPDPLPQDTTDGRHDSDD